MPPTVFTCLSCGLAFADPEQQKAHHQTDWHQYNLRRKILNMQPVSAEVFREKVLAQQAALAQPEQLPSYCECCHKKFRNEKSFENHQKSAKHIEADIKWQAVEAKKHEGKVIVDALQSVQASQTKFGKAESSIKNPDEVPLTGTGKAVDNSPTSSKTEKMVIESEAVDELGSDSESVESWDGEALGIEECLFCSYISTSLDDNVKHMSLNHSFFIPDVEYLTDLEGLIGYLGEKIGEGHMCLWCNTRSKVFQSVKSVQQHMVDKGHCKMLYEGDAIIEYADYYDYSSSYPDQEEGGAEKEVKLEELTEKNCQLVLPSGSVIGHRALQRYYRQSLKPARSIKPGATTGIIAQYRALGWLGTTGAAALQKARDVAYFQRIKSRNHVRLGMKHNKFQPHFRDDVFGIGR